MHVGNNIKYTQVNTEGTLIEIYKIENVRCKLMVRHLVKFPCRPTSVSTFTFLGKTVLFIHILELYMYM